MNLKRVKESFRIYSKSISLSHSNRDSLIFGSLLELRCGRRRWYWTLRRETNILMSKFSKSCLIHPRMVIDISFFILQPLFSTCQCLWEWIFYARLLIFRFFFMVKPQFFLDCLATLSKSIKKEVCFIVWRFLMMDRFGLGIRKWIFGIKVRH